MSRGSGAVVIAALVLATIPAREVFAHDNVPALAMEGELSAEAVVPEHGAPAPSGAPPSATFLGFLDDVEPILDYRILLSGLDLATEVESVTLRLASPGQNGPHVLNVWGSTGQDDANLIVSTSGGLLVGLWSDADENFGLDGIRDPEDSVGLGSVVESLIRGEVYVSVTTFAHPYPETAALRGQIQLEAKPAIVVGRRIEHVDTTDDLATTLQPVRVFQGLTANSPAAGGYWTNTPRISSTASPDGLSALGAGVLAFDVLVEPLSGRNLSFWDGTGAVAFGPVPADEQVTLSLGSDSRVLDGGAALVPGFPLGTTLGDGSGIDVRWDAVISASDEPSQGVYLAALRFRHENAPIPASPSPSSWIVWGGAAPQFQVDAAVAWLEANRAIPACQDGYDAADGDVLVDLADPGCASAFDLSEYALATECDNGLDDDGDGRIDFGDDPDCLSAIDPFEVPEPSFPGALALGACLLLVGRDHRAVGALDRSV